MRRLIYISTACRQPDQALLDKILVGSRAVNTTIGVTGMLIAHSHKFLQVLEGDQASIDQVMKRVRSSQKHSGIITLVDIETNTRLFPDWSMGYERLAKDEDIKGFTTITNAALRFRESGAPEMETLLDAFFERWADLPRSVIAEQQREA
ncbi:MAG: BLUF domain-containing protein [Pseudomonadota bacterium]